MAKTWCKRASLLALLATTSSRAWQAKTPTFSRAETGPRHAAMASLESWRELAPSWWRWWQDTAAGRRWSAAQKAFDLGLGDAVAAHRLWAGRWQPQWLAEAQRLPAKATDTLLQWPVVEGTFVRGFGSGPGGYHLAIDVRAPRGEAVRAAAAGLVAYVGDALRGYGNVVILLHAAGFATLYAHNDRTLAALGMHVQAGETIAEVGNTGKSRGPHLHFELLQDGKNCDPMPWFRQPVEETGRQAFRCRARIAFPGGSQETVAEAESSS